MKNTYLAHHGILGMRWGIRRYQNKDGSLTSEGKKHQKELADSYRSSHSETVQKIASSGKEVQSAADDIMEQYKKYYSSLQKDPKFKDEVLNRLYQKFGDGVDDDELYDMEMFDTVQEVVEDMTPEYCKQAYKNFDEVSQNYSKVVNQYCQQFFEEHKNESLSEFEKVSIQKDILDGTGDGWTSYIIRNSDYWPQMGELDEEMNLYAMFTMDDYNTRFAN